MSARITQPDAAVLKRIFAAWHASLPNMIDDERKPEGVFIPIQEVNTHWYVLPQDSFLILRKTLPQDCARVQILTSTGEVIVDPSGTRDVLREAMREFQLNRLNAVIPSPLQWRDYKLLGFKHEGRIRKSVRFNGEWTDAEIMGALATEVGIPRRRRRKRRAKASNSQESAVDAESRSNSGTKEE
jgi:hypothetical protein